MRVSGWPRGASFGNAREVRKLFHEVVSRHSAAVVASGIESGDALRDLEEYLKVARLSEQDDDQKKETEQVWEHVKTLRRRVAQLN